MSKHKPALVYVDDEVLGLQVTFIGLKDEFDVHSSKSPREMLQKIATIDPVIILSDLMMPEMNGVEFLEEAKKICPKARRIILTGYEELNDTLDAINRGIVHSLIMKPCKGNALEVAMLKAYEDYKLT